MRRTAVRRLRVVKQSTVGHGNVQATVSGLDRRDPGLQRLHMPDQLRDNAGPPAIRSGAIVRAGVGIGRRHEEYIGRDQEENIRVIGLAHYPSKQSSASGSELSSDHHRPMRYLRSAHKARSDVIDVCVQRRSSPWTRRRVPVRLGFPPRNVCPHVRVTVRSVYYVSSSS